MGSLSVEGIFTHFACSDAEDESATLKQYDKFMYVVSELEKQGLCIPIKHCCNSAAIVKYPQMHLDMVRAGIILYGMYPSDIDYDIDLKPLMNFKTSVINVKTVEAGQSISYGATFTAIPFSSNVILLSGISKFKYPASSLLFFKT